MGCGASNEKDIVLPNNNNQPNNQLEQTPV